MAGGGESSRFVKTPKVLRDAIQSWTSRPGASSQLLARQARVSPRVLRLIQANAYVRDVPKAKPQQRAGWAGTLARLARAVDVDPELVIAQHGIPIDNIAKRAIEAAGISLEERRLPYDPSLQTVESRSGHVRVAILNYHEFYGSKINGYAGPFFQTLCDQIVRLVNPRYEIIAERCDSVRDLLRHLNAGAELAIGSFSVPSRRIHGLRFFPLPGLRVHLVGLALTNRGDPVDWKDLGPSIQPQVVVIGGEAGDLWASGPGAFGCGAVSILQVEEEAAVATRVVEEWIATWGMKSRCVVFFADYFSVRSIEHLLVNQRERLSPELQRSLASDQPRIQWLLDANGIAPEHQIALAVREDSPRWGSLVGDALTHLYGDYPHVTARLYAEFLIKILKLHEANGHRPVVRLPFRYRFEDPAVEVRFRAALWGEVLRCLQDRHQYTRPEERSCGVDPRFVADLRSVFSPEWLAVIAQATKAISPDALETRIARAYASSVMAGLLREYGRVVHGYSELATVRKEA